MIISKVTKKQGFNLSLGDALFEKPQGQVKLTRFPPSLLPPAVSCYREPMALSKSENKLQIFADILFMIYQHH